MVHFTVEETNLLSIYREDSRAQTMENITAALPYMDEEMRVLAEHTLAKVDGLTGEEYRGLPVYAAGEA